MAPADLRGWFPIRRLPLAIAGWIWLAGLLTLFQPRLVPASDAPGNLPTNLGVAPQVLESINRIRDQAGLPRFTPNRLLGDGALAHARYLQQNFINSTITSAHDQLPGQPYFLAKDPPSRALAIGYAHSRVLENVEIGSDRVQAAIDGLMGAIYHRLAFLDLDSDALGQASLGNHHVFLMGRDDLAEICAVPPRELQVQTRIDCAGFIVGEDWFNGLCDQLPVEALFRPAWPWPCADGTLLDAGYMTDLCAAPPAGALFDPALGGSYYQLCDQRFDTGWFNHFCAHLPAAAHHRGGDQFFAHCHTQLDADWLKQRCAANPLPADAGRFEKALCGSGERLDQAALEAHDRELRGVLPNLIVWPPQDGTDIPPAFYEEQPDPLPDRSVSGYPLSVQVNPSHAREVELVGFRLFDIRVEPPREITSTRLLDAHNDPNQLLNDHQFALFPLQRLNWGGRYQARLVLRLDGRETLLEWRFATRQLPGRLVSTEDPDDWTMQANEPLYIYRPPGEGVQSLEGLSVQLARDLPASFRAIDPHTAELRLKGERTARCRLRELEVRFGDGLRRRLRVEGCGAS